MSNLRIEINVEEVKRSVTDKAKKQIEEYLTKIVNERDSSLFCIS